jgi:hypothetical protein
MQNLGFQVDTRLVSLLSDTYTSSERALKELVDNAWDADAEVVEITLPDPMSDDPILVKDSGSGMTQDELEREYLFIGRDRRKRRGERTPGKQRRVKGRKGIGKFAGLRAARAMRLETWTRGKLCAFELRTEDLQTVESMGQLRVPVHVSDADPESSGTRIILSELDQSLRFPDPDKLRQLLLQEYGREDGFDIIVNGKTLDVDDVAGSYNAVETEIEGLGHVKLRFSISEEKKKLRQPGIAVRVNGKVVGDPTFFGLDKAEDFPLALLDRLYGEVEADGLQDHVTADWGALLENSELFAALEEYARPVVNEKFKEVYGQEINLAQARLKKKIDKRLSQLPEYKRQYAEKAIKAVLRKFYQEPDTKLEPVVDVLLDAIELSDYRALVEHIHSAKRREVAQIAEALSEFGLAEVALMTEQAIGRLVYLDRLEEVCADSSTLEQVVHTSIENNLWLFGPEYSLFSSNKTLKRIVNNYLGEEYSGELATRRPDLLLNEDFRGRFLLIEFKRPSHRLTYEDYQQATRYRNELSRHTGKPIDVLLLGGRFGTDLPPRENRERSVEILMFNDVISSARRQFEWLLEELQTEREAE